MELKGAEKLSDCEEMIMDIIWHEPKEPDLMTITEKANKKYGKNWKIQTVATFLSRLEKKGWIYIYRIGRYSHYRALIEFNNYLKEHISEFLNMAITEGSDEQLRSIIDKLQEELNNRKK